MRRDLFIAAALVVATIAVYGQVYGHGFVVIDDMHYVVENHRITAGLTLGNVAWALGAVHAGNWHPLTTLSHMLDCELFGTRAGAHHLINLLLHVVNTVLLFIVLRKTTRASWASGFVAALFALHPLHVESVAWVSERKDVLSTLFWMLALWAYAAYVSRPRATRYLLVMSTLTLGLLSKPMVVTLPCVLVLMDVWPLERLDRGRIGRSLGALLLEKLPLFVLAAGASVATLFVQAPVLADSRSLTIPVRVGTALVSYVWYLAKSFWPSRLAVFYPHTHTVEPWAVLGSALLLAMVTLLAVATWRSRPYLLVGWLWYLGTLVPVIGLVQVGEQTRADRYTYIPLIGVFLMLGWGVAHVRMNWRLKPPVLGAAGAAVLLALAICSWFQVALWKDNLSLLTHAARVTKENAPVMTDLGLALSEAGRDEDAMAMIESALTIRPGYARAHALLGILLARKAEHEGAMEQFRLALRNDPGDADSHYNLGLALVVSGRVEPGIEHMTEAVRLEPGHVRAHDQLGQVYVREGRYDRALPHLEQLVRLRPRDLVAVQRLADVLFRLGRFRDAVDATERALALSRDHGTEHLTQRLREQLDRFRAALAEEPPAHPPGSER